MIKFAPLIAAAGALALVAGCADYYGDYGDYGPGPGYYGPVAPVAYDGYYDDYYGPFYDGYWGADGFFYYRNSDRDQWRRDTGHHFAHEAAAGFHPVQSRPRPPGRPPRRDHDGG
ncbi:MAG: hypothetical protein ACYC8V_11470 [Caulobacteraceae bacterium]